MPGTSSTEVSERARQDQIEPTSGNTPTGGFAGNGPGGGRSSVQEETTVATSTSVPTDYFAAAANMTAAPVKNAASVQKTRETAAKVPLQPMPVETMRSAPREPAMHEGMPRIVNPAVEEGQVESVAAPMTWEESSADLEKQAGDADLQNSADIGGRPSAKPRALFNISEPEAPKPEPVVLTDQEKTDAAETVAMVRESREAAKKTVEEAGRITLPEAPITYSGSNVRYPTSLKEFREEKKEKVLGGRDYSGTAFYETAVSDSTCPPHCVSVGVDLILASMREPDSMFLNLVNKELARRGGSPITADDVLDNPSRLIDLVNNHLTIEVVVEKAPVNVRNSIQVRELRLAPGRGVGMHPTQLKAYNADFDGDEVFVNLDQKQLMRFPRAMEVLIDAEGTPTIDPDFFPIDPIDNDDARKEARKLLTELAKENAYLKNDAVRKAFVDNIIGAYVELCNDMDWYNFLNALDKASEKVVGRFSGSRKKNEVISSMFQLIYDFGCERRSLNLRASSQTLDTEEYDYKDLDSFELDVVDQIKMIARGNPCPSNIEFYRLYTRQYGDLENPLEGKSGKNVPFRLLADIAKAVNRTDLIQIGADVWGVSYDKNGEMKTPESISIDKLWEFTCIAGLSKMIANRACVGSRELAVSTQVKTVVTKDCPIPRWDDISDPQQRLVVFRAWIKDFIKVYNKHIRMLNFAQTAFKGGMAPQRIDDIKIMDGIQNIGADLGRALLKVYGDRSLERVFPIRSFDKTGFVDNSGNAIAKYWMKFSLSDFSRNGRFSFDSSNKKTWHENFKEKWSRNDFMPIDIIGLVKDYDSKQNGNYRKEWMKTTEEQFRFIVNLKHYPEGSREREEYFNNFSEFVHLMYPEMFDHFGMVSPATFANSKWGRALTECVTLDDYRSTLIKMETEYRMSRPAKIISAQRDIEKKSTGFSENDNQKDLDRLLELDTVFELEMDSLGTSSMLWKAITSDAMNDNYNWHRLIETKGVISERWSMYAAPTEKNPNPGVEFWNRSDLKMKTQSVTDEEDVGEVYLYESVLDFMKSDEPFDTKMAVLADFTRISENYLSITPNQILGQLVSHPERLRAGSQSDMDLGIKTEIDYLKESAKRLSSYRSDTPMKIREAANDLLEEAEKNKTSFMEHLNRLATDPSYAVRVDTILAADAIASVYEKAYTDSEKIRQQQAVNGYFGAISYQRSGGYYTHVYMADNAVVNVVGYDQLTSQDIVRVLANPKLAITTYDEYGNPAVISRDILCNKENAGVDDILRYLRGNPKIALSLRCFTAGVKSDVDGGAFITASHGVGEDSRSSGDKVFGLLNDRPRFLAMAALFTPGNGKTGRTMSEDINGTIKSLCDFISAEAFSRKSDEEILEDFVARTGFTKENILKLRTSGRFDESEIMQSDQDSVSWLYGEVIHELQSCISLARGTIDTIVSPVMPTLSEVKSIGSMDESSMISYYDVKQQIGGARTATMIGIEGAETKKNLILKQFLLSRPDKWTMDENGVPVKVSLDNESVADQSLTMGKLRKITSIAKWLEAKREKGAETYNAKAKKYGDDGTNSMIKFIRFGTEDVFARYGKDPEKDNIWTAEQAAALRAEILGCKSKNEAVPKLAEALIEADRRLGYLDGDSVFLPSDYYNRADLMLAENSDGVVPKLVIRTVEQLAIACRNRLSDEAIASGNREFVMSELYNIVDVVGTDRDPFKGIIPANEVAYRCMANVRVKTKCKNDQISRAIRSRASSPERSYMWILSKWKKFEEDFTEGKAFSPRNQQARRERAVSAFRELTVPQQQQIQSLVMPKFSKKIPPANKSFEYLYDFLGRYDRATTDRYAPGPQSLIFFCEDSKGRIADPKKFSSKIEDCKKYGMTAVLDQRAYNWLSNIDGGAYLQKNCIPAANDLFLLSFFDMELNGFGVDSAIAPSPGEYPTNPENYVVNVESTHPEIKAGDATYHPTSELMKRVRLFFRKQARFTKRNLFSVSTAYFLEKYGNNISMQMDFCTNEEIQKYIVNGEFDPNTVSIKGVSEAVIDLGMTKADAGFKEECDRFALRLEEYKRNFGSADADGIIHGDVERDSIVGWVKLVVNNGKFGTVIAPVWAFHLKDSGRPLSKFRVERFNYDEDSDSFVVDYLYTGGIEGQFLKMFEGIGASNKMIVSRDTARSRTLANGLPIDGFYSTKSVASRLFPTNKRLATMITVMNMTRVDPRYAYNFMDSAGAFPGFDDAKPLIITRNDEEHTQIDVRQAVADCTMGMTDWIALDKMVDEGVCQYHSDEEINSLVRFWVKRCIAYGTVNPNILLATKSRNGIMWPRGTEFEAFLDPGYNFQNAWMKFLSSVTKGLVPENIQADSTNTLFKPIKNNGKEGDYGTLQMVVPYYNSDGTTTNLLQNVYISMSFFGDEFSGYKKVNFNAKKRSIDALNVAREVDGFDLKNLLSFGRAGMTDSKLPSGANTTEAEVADSNEEVQEIEGA